MATSFLLQLALEFRSFETFGISLHVNIEKMLNFFLEYTVKEVTFWHTVLVDTPCLFLSQQRVAASLPLYWSIKSKSHTNFNFTSYFCVSSGTLVSSSIFHVQVHHVIKPLLFEGFDCFNALIAIFLEFLVSLFDKKHHIVPSRTPLNQSVTVTVNLFNIFNQSRPHLF